MREVALGLTRSGPHTGKEGFMSSEKVILLVEDNRDDEELAIRALKKNNIPNAVVVARDGVQAIDYLFGNNGQAGAAPTLPQVILLDLNLPKLNGLDVLRKIRSEQRTRFLPVVVLTSSKEEEDILNSYTLGANSYVRKPVDFAQFIEAVKTLGQFWLSLNEQPTAR
jgi:CheY-like chemotaxis protein